MIYYFIIFYGGHILANEFFNSFLSEFGSSLPYLLRMVIAVVCGAAIGFERMKRQKEAGIRTHIIVALGSALMMIVSKYGFFDVIVNDSVSVDASRVAANIITGISFLGSGIIIFKGYVKGLTTAAGVWVTSGIGMAIGAGMYGVGIMGTALLLLIQVLIHKFLPIENTTTANLSMKVKNEPGALHTVHTLLKEHDCDVLNCDIEKKDEIIYCAFGIRSKKNLSFESAQVIFSECDYVLSITM